MLKIKLQGLESIPFNKKLEVKGSIPGYFIEHQELEGKLCETSMIIYPTGEYESEEDKFTAICAELSCNQETFVSFYSTDRLIEYFEVDEERFTVKELYEKYKENCTVLYGCDQTGVKAPQAQLQDIVKCNSEYGCDFCMYRQGRYYSFDLDGNKVRLEVLGEGCTSEEDIEFHFSITTPKLMKEIEKLESEW